MSEYTNQSGRDAVNFTGRLVPEVVLREPGAYAINPAWRRATHHIVFASQFLPGGCFEGLSLEEAVEQLDQQCKNT